MGATLRSFLGWETAVGEFPNPSSLFPPSFWQESMPKSRSLGVRRRALAMGRRLVHALPWTGAMDAVYRMVDLVHKFLHWKTNQK
jgi:hypothetical protein